MMLGEFASPEVAAVAPLTLLLPLGATEQHGPHLPLDTDTRIALAVAEGVAASLPDVVVAPPIAVGASGEHAGFAGTLSVGSRVLSEMVIEIVRTAGPEFARVAVINAHGGNVDALRAAAAVCRAEGRDVLVWSVGVAGGDAHAGRTETSLLLALAPQHVRLDRAEAGAREPLEELLPRMVEDGVGAVAPNGVLGDPAGASADEGARVLARLVADAVARLGG